MKLIGTRSNRDSIGARVTLTTSSGVTLMRMVKGGSSYLSQSELPLTFGLGKPGSAKSVRLQIVWSSGQKDLIASVKPNQFVTVKEGQGIISATPINFAAGGRRTESSPQQ